MNGKQYGEYLTGVKGEQFRDIVFEYIEKEDTRRSVNFQLDVMKKVGFTQLDILHKNSMYATFGGIKD